MATNNADEFRTRAAQARRIADDMHDGPGQAELRDMADALDEEAAKIEAWAATNPTPPVSEA